MEIIRTCRWTIAIPLALLALGGWLRGQDPQPTARELARHLPRLDRGSEWIQKQGYFAFQNLKRRIGRTVESIDDDPDDAIRSLSLAIGEYLNRTGSYCHLVALSDDAELREMSTWGPGACIRAYPDLCDLIRSIPAERLAAPARHLRAALLRSMLWENLLQRSSGIEELEVVDNTLGELARDYMANLSRAEHIRFDPERLAGLPAHILRQCGTEEDGGVRLQVNSAVIFAVLTRVHDARTRRAMQRAHRRLGGDENRQALPRILASRHRIGEFLSVIDGAPGSYIDLALSFKLIGDEAHLRVLLDAVERELVPRYRELLGELAELKRELASERSELLTPEERTQQGETAAPSLKPWDPDYYLDHLASRACGAIAIHDYFPLEVTVQRSLAMFARLFGLYFQRVAPASARPHTWSESVELYSVRDVSSGELLAFLYLDLKPRAGKLFLPYCLPLNSGHRFVGSRRVRVLALVGTLAERCDLLELMQLFHELGHCVHGIVDRSEHLHTSFSTIPAEFIEAPAIVAERWIWNPALLSQVAIRPLPQRFLDQLEDIGRRWTLRISARQYFYARLDLELHAASGREGFDPVAIWNELYRRILLLDPSDCDCDLGALPVVVDSGGVALHCYVLGSIYARLLAEPLHSGGTFPPGAIARLRKLVLEPAASAPPHALVERYLGREIDREEMLRNAALLLIGAGDSGDR